MTDKKLWIAIAFSLACAAVVFGLVGYLAYEIGYRITYGHPSDISTLQVWCKNLNAKP